MNANNNLGGALAFACICIGLVLVIVLAIYIFFCLTLQSTMKSVRPRNREMAPGLVWLHLLHLGGSIPIAGIVISIAASIWDLIMVLKIGASIKNDFEDRGFRTDGEGFGRPAGLIWVVIQLAVTPLGLAINLLGQQVGDPSIVLAISLVVLALALTAFVCWIIYWVQIASYGRRLREGYGGYRRGGVEEDYDDEFRGPVRRRSDEDDRYDRDREDEVEDEPFNLDRLTRRGRDDEYDDRDDDRPRPRDREDDK